MSARSARLSLAFSCLGHAYMHMFTAFYFIIVLAIEIDWNRPYHELIELWTLGAALVGLGAIPAGWLGDRWSAPGMMTVFFIGLGLSGIACAFVDSETALLLGLAAIGLFSAIYHPVGIAWVVRNAESRGKALGINGVFGNFGVAVAGIVAGGLIDLFGWRAAFLVPGIVCLVTGLGLLACMVLGLVEEGGDRRVEAPPARGDMVRAIGVLLFTMLCLGLVFQSSQAALPKVFDLRLSDLAGDGVFGIGMIVAGVYTVGGVIQVFGGHLADKYPLKPIYLGAFALQVPMLIAVAALSGLPLILAAVFAVMLTTGALPAENMLLARYVPQNRRSLAYGVKFVLAFGSAPLALAFVAFIKESTGEFVWLFASLALVALAAAAAITLLPGERLRQSAAPAPAE